MDRDDKGRFAPGNPGGPGRPEGSRNKLSESYLKALADDFAENGVETIVRLREERPDVYIGAIGKLMPKLLEHTGKDGEALPNLNVTFPDFNGRSSE